MKTGKWLKAPKEHLFHNKYSLLLLILILILLVSPFVSNYPAISFLAESILFIGAILIVSRIQGPGKALFRVSVPLACIAVLFHFLTLFVAENKYFILVALFSYMTFLGVNRSMMKKKTRDALLFLWVLCIALTFPWAAFADRLDNWQWRNPLPQGSTLRSIAYGKSTFVAVGSGRTILTSPDGAAWQPRTSGTDYDLYGIAFGNNTFVAVGDGGTILTSSDGIGWTASNSGIIHQLNAVAYGNDTFVAVG